MSATATMPMPGDIADDLYPSEIARRAAKQGWLKWAILLSASFGAILEVIDVSIINVAIPHMQQGQKVKLTIDAIPGKTFIGQVDSFSPASGNQFALLPADNLTGNFTKIVQRLPVKIVFDPDSVKGYEDRINPGLSVIVKVRVR